MIAEIIECVSFGFVVLGVALCVLSLFGVGFDLEDLE